MSKQEYPGLSDENPILIGDSDAALDALGFVVPSFTLAFLRSSPDSVSLLNRGGVLRYMNDNGLKLLGFAPKDCIAGLPWESLWSAEDRTAVRTAVGAAAAGQVTRYTKSLGYLNAPDLSCAVTLCPILNTRRDVDGILAILRADDRVETSQH